MAGGNPQRASLIVSDSSPTSSRNAEKSVATAAWLVLVGTLASGPVGISVVAVTHPQPVWQDAETFVTAYHSVQNLPYYFGFVLVGGFMGLVMSLRLVAPDRLSGRMASVSAFAGAFGAMVLTNYAIQTTFIPSLLSGADPNDLPLVGAMTMANPRSFGWALEMWGYAVLGTATWLVAPAFAGSALERAVGWMFVVNGPVSVAGGLATALRPGWVLTTPGLLAFALWNLLVVAMAVGAIVAMRLRRASTSR